MYSKLIVATVCFLQIKGMTVLRRDKWVGVMRRIYSEAPSNAEWKRIVDRSGLSTLLRCEIQHVNHNLVAAFVERWHPETNMFHLPFGEMTITLHDLALISGLPINENALERRMTDDQIRVALHYLWSLSATELRDSISYGGVKMTLLRGKMNEGAGGTHRVLPLLI